MDLLGPKDIKERVKIFITKNGTSFTGKKVVDIPAGNGYTTSLLLNAGADVQAFDLIPEFFTEKRIDCKYADMSKKIPLEDNSVDIVFFQEGIEHLENPSHTLRELNRILKKDGELYITTPNISKLKSRVSHFLFETETIIRRMPPNELDSVWMVKNNTDIYYGHIFLIGPQKLRTLAALSGFNLEKSMGTRANGKSLFYFLLFYLFILLSSSITFLKNSLKAKKQNNANIKLKLYRQQFRLNIHPRTLLSGHIFMKFIKTDNYSEVPEKLDSKLKSFNIKT